MNDLEVLPTGRSKIEQSSTPYSTAKSGLISHNSVYQIVQTIEIEYKNILHESIYRAKRIEVSRAPCPNQFDTYHNAKYILT